HGWGARAARRTAVAFAALVALVLVLGQVRLALFAPAGPTVRVASFSRRLHGTELTRQAYRREAADRATAADLAEIRRREGAGNARTFKEDEAAWLERACALARANRIYLGVALSTWTRGLAQPRENKLLLIAPTGRVEWQYLKARPVPFAESKSRPGDGTLP